MIKKLAFVSLLSLLFLLPLNVKADSDFYTGAFTWKYSNNANVPLLTNSDYQTHTSYNNGSSTPYQNYTFYLSNVGLGSFDYSLISTYIRSDSTLFISDPCSSSATCNYDDGPSYSLSILYHRSNNVQYEAPCQLISSSGITTQFGLWKCPIGTNATSFDGIHFSVYDNHNYQNSTGLLIGANKWATFHYTDSTSSNIATGITQQTQAINNMNNNLSNMNDNISDMNDTMTDMNDNISDINDNLNSTNVSDANDAGDYLFSHINSGSQGSLTTIVTAPLAFLNAITDTCQPVTLPFSFENLNATPGAIQINPQNVSLPCGTTLFWENQSLGNKVSTFRTFWNLLLGGPIIYGLLVLLMKAINNALDPVNDELIFLSPSVSDARDERTYNEMYKRSEMSDAVKRDRSRGDKI